MNAFLFALFLVCASTLMYEVVLTRLLSVISWYYLAFVSISMAMFGMTAGALSVQLRPDFFSPSMIRRRLALAALATAISTPLALLVMLAIPIDIAFSLQTLISFLLFSAVIAVPFFFPASLSAFPSPGRRFPWAASTSWISPAPLSDASLPYSSFIWSTPPARSFSSPACSS